MALWLSAAEVEPLLDLDGAMAVTAEAFKEQSASAVATLAPSMLRTRKGMFRIVTGALLNSGRMGVRVGPALGYTDRIASDKMLAALYDAESGELLSVMGYPFGTLRTGATVGLATKLFAREDARVAAMLGTGRNAVSLLKAVCHVRPIELVLVYSPTAQHRLEFVERASQELRCRVEAVDRAEAATLGADVVCVATNAPAPVATAEQLSAGTFVATMGRPSELDPSIYLKADLIVVGNKEQEAGYFDMRNYTHQLLKLANDGKLDWSKDVLEMSDVVAGRKPKRASNDQLIVFKESQGGFGDMAFANHVYEQAKQRGLGREVPL